MISEHQKFTDEVVRLAEERAAAMRNVSSADSSRDGRYSSSGSQSKGSNGQYYSSIKGSYDAYANGTKSAKKGLAIVDDGDGRELIIKNPDKGRVTNLDGGEVILDAKQTKNIVELADMMDSGNDKLSKINLIRNKLFGSNSGGLSSILSDKASGLINKMVNAPVTNNSQEMQTINTYHFGDLSFPNVRNGNDMSECIRTLRTIAANH